MNVLVISSIYPSTQDPVSGIFVKEQVGALIDQGCQIKVISPTPWAPFPLNLLSRKWHGFRNKPGFDIGDGIEVYYPRYLSFPRNWFAAGSGRRMYLGMKDLIGQIAQEFPIDLIHAHVALPAGYAAMKAAEQFQLPFLVSIHGADLQKTIHLNRACREVIGQTLAGSAKAVFVSTKLLGLAEEFFGGDQKYQVIANGVNPSFLGESPAGNPQETLLLSVSNLIPSKGIDQNIYAMNELAADYPGLKYKVIGQGPEYKRLVRMARDLGLSEKVEFLGQVTRDQVFRYLAECDIFSLPSWQEGFGIVYLEAMAHAKPVIGCRGEGIEDFVNHGETGYLVNPKDPVDLAQTIKELLDQPEKRIDTGGKAQQIVLEGYTWEENARKMIQIYREILQDR